MCIVCGMRFVAGLRVKISAIVLATLFLSLACTTIASAAADGAAEHVRVSPSLREMDDNWGDHARTARIMLILVQIAVMLAAAKLAGWMAERIKVPGVIGELLAGVIIGPYLLGQLIQV